MKNMFRSLVVSSILCAVYSVIAFAIPFARTAVFWLSYVFGVIAIATQIFVLRVAFVKERSVKSKFYGFPVAKVGITYMLVQLVLGLVMMALAAVAPVYVPLVVYMVLLAVAAVGFISADAMRDEVEWQDVQLKKDIATMRALQAKINCVVGVCSDDVRQDISKLAEELRYSDPVSNETIRNIENELTSCVDELQSAVMDGDYTAVKELCRKARATLVERNRLCKLNKG